MHYHLLLLLLLLLWLHIHLHNHIMFGRRLLSLHKANILVCRLLLRLCRHMCLLQRGLWCRGYVLIWLLLVMSRLSLRPRYQWRLLLYRHRQ